MLKLFKCRSTYGEDFKCERFLFHRGLHYKKSSRYPYVKLRWTR